MKILLCFVFLTIKTFSNGQNGDCIKAINICNKDSLNLVFSFGNVSGEVTRSNSSCFDDPNDPFDIERNSVWIKWDVTKSGKLTFIVAPQLFADIDFVIFKLVNKNCSDLKVVRCEASVPCNNLRNTGLREGETDEFEPSGCLPNNNGFLAPLEVMIGEQYMLFINDFSSSTTRTSMGTITFGGTAEIGCQTSHIFSNETFTNILVYPNPSHSILNLGTTEIIAKLSIVNSLGQTIISVNRKDMHNTLRSLSISGLSTGQYFIQGQMQDGKLFYQKFIKN